MDNLTNTIGKKIRDILREDNSFNTILGKTTADAKNYIFLSRPTDQKDGFINPRVVVQPGVSDSDELKHTGIFKGTEQFLLNIWTDDGPSYDTVMNALDRAVTLFNNTDYVFQTVFGINNKGVFKCTGKVSIPDPDKENTTKGDMFITLNIGGI